MSQAGFVVTTSQGLITLVQKRWLCGVCVCVGGCLSGEVSVRESELSGGDGMADKGKKE